jgi:hypothetical protein
MKKIIVSVFFAFLLVHNVLAQTRTVYEHSASFQQIADKYQKRALDTSTKFKYYNYSLETKDLPVLNEAEKKIIGKDNFVIYWLSGLNNDINFLYLCNYEANEAIIFSFRKEFLEGSKPCSAEEIKNDIFYLFVSKYLDPKWIGAE